MSRFSSLLCSLLFCMITYAQEITVTGKVTAGGEEMPGVTVAVKVQVCVINWNVSKIVGCIPSLLLAEILLWDACWEKLGYLVLVPTKSFTCPLHIGCQNSCHSHTVWGHTNVGTMLNCLLFSLLGFILKAHFVPDSIKEIVNLIYSIRSKI